MFQLPEAEISGEPLLCSVFELNNNNPTLMALTNQVYMAHEANYNSDKSNMRLSVKEIVFDTGFIYESVVMPDGRTWLVTQAGRVA